MRHRTRQHGYILILVLVLLALMAFAVMGLARSSLEASVQANTAAADLQRRWGAATCRGTLLDRADEIFEQRHKQYLALFDDEQREPSFSDLEWVTDETQDQVEGFRYLRGSVVLGNLRFEVVLSDEQAKVNLNEVLEDADAGAVEAAVDQLADTRLDTPRLNLRPLPEADAKRLELPRLPNWDYVFDSVNRDAFMTNEIDGTSVFDRMTCWGDGRIRWDRAENVILRHALTGVLDDERLERLLELRQEQPDMGLDRILDVLAPRRDVRSDVKRRLTEKSSCFGLWIQVSSDRRTWTEWSVREGRGQVANVKRYRW